MKKAVSLLLSLSLLFAPAIHAEEETFYYDEDEEFFNHGTLVGEDSGEFARMVRRQRMKNWGIAVGTTLIGIATLVLVGHNHNK